VTNYLRLFVSPRGVINRRSYWHGVLVITALNLALVLASSSFAPGNVRPWGVLDISTMFLGPLLTIWFSGCVAAKRLRAIGASPWRTLPARIFVALGILFVSVHIIGYRPGAIDGILILLVILAFCAGVIDDVWTTLRLGIFAKERAMEPMDHVFG